MVKIHRLADVQSPHIGKNTQIWQYSVILKNARIGENCNINCHTFIENDVIIGKNVTVKSGVFLWDGITIEDDVFLGPNVTFTNDIVPRSKKYPEKFSTTLIKRGASIGANVTIIGGITISKYALIGAGSVVTKDVPAYTLWYGNPAKQHGFVCECGNKLSSELHCTKCKKSYKLQNNTISEL
ncbi:acetyltransferase-like isoleucine patch superfamily enzyme [Marinilabilia salmonicolor]|jgi:acetyltransferase-like isoleucine patch superfamily enzyme|uniref:acyltransferase n=1 Tax=Marinilabilia salmonicolor TaxID=989 RepID=UPI000D0749A2|nr:acyltransferase [Marinilabilia salmonicolor]PRZ00816.1 acetyltransferase-like isoleucine patch superfamily enzyme [Marinilabilia salmonicolor]